MQMILKLLILKICSFLVKFGASFSSNDDLLVIQILKSQAVNCLENLSQCPEGSEGITDIIHLMHVADILQRHFELTLALLQTDSEEEIEPIKQKFEAIRSQYEGIRSKEDITTVPTKYVVMLFHDKLVVELTRILKKCFKKSWTTGRIQLVKDHDNIAKVKILVISPLISNRELIFSH